MKILDRWFRTSAALLLVAVSAPGCSDRALRSNEVPLGSALPDGTLETDDDAEWVALPVLNADVMEKDGRFLVTAETRTPAGEWQLELRPLSTDQVGMREFLIVGRGPDARGGRGVPQSVSRWEQFDESVEQVVVQGSDGAIIAEVR